jgi:hypothetical protein
LGLRPAKKTAVPGFEARVHVPGSARLAAKRLCEHRPYANDLDFPHFIAQAAKANADLLLVPASDWCEIVHIHLVHAI